MEPHVAWAPILLRGSAFFFGYCAFISMGFTNSFQFMRS